MPALILMLRSSNEALCRETVEAMGHRILLAQDKDEAETLLSREPIDLLILPIQDPADDFAFFDRSKKIRPACQGIALIGAALEDYFPELIERAYPDNFIADNHPLDRRELAVTLHKLITGDIFGMEKYGISPVETMEIRFSAERNVSIEKVCRFFREKDIPLRLVENVELILNELLLNAIFNAPVDGEGKKLYEHLDRSLSFELKVHERPLLQYGIGEDSLAVSVADPFGSLKKETFYAYVHRCFVEKSVSPSEGPGAGLGLFLVFKSLGQLVMNIAPLRKTEIIAFLPIGASAGELKKRRRSFHHFHTGNFIPEKGGLS